MNGDPCLGTTFPFTFVQRGDKYDVINQVQLPHPMPGVTKDRGRMLVVCTCTTLEWAQYIAEILSSEFEAIQEEQGAT